MSRVQANASLALRLWEACSHGDAEQLRELLTADVVWRAAGHNPYSGEVKGVEGVLDQLARRGEDVDELRSQLRDIFGSAGGAVIWATTLAERGPVTLHLDCLMLLQIANGRVYEVTSVPLDQARNDAFWRLQ